VPKLTINIGVLLIILGILSYILTGATSATALIPSFFGLAFIGLGALGKKNESMRKHAMHAALLLAILGLGGSFGGLMNLFGMIGGETPERMAASIGQALMALICIFFIVAGVKSFIDARKKPAADTTFEDGANN
jgi:peptidoglycan/LPS O-acetylase OafA/YrhL